MARTTRLATVPLGRLGEWRDRPDASLLATSPNGWDFDVYRYPSRAALLAFCKRDGQHSALVKDRVHPTMLANRNTQVADESSPLPPSPAAGGAK